MGALRLTRRVRWRGRHRAAPGANVTISPIHREMTTSLSCWCSRPESDAGERLCTRSSPALQKKYRRVLELWFPAGHSIEEASDIMAISVSNAALIQRCALRMTARLAQEAAR